MLSAGYSFAGVRPSSGYFSAPKGDGHKNAVFTCLSMVVLAATKWPCPGARTDGVI